MKFTKIVILSVYCVVLATVQLTTAIEVEAREGHTQDAGDLYAQYQQYASNIQQHHQQQAQGKPIPYGITKKQDFASDIESLMGPDAALILGGVGLALGTVSIVVAAIQGTESRSICSASKALGNTALTLSTTTTVPTTYAQASMITAFNNIENAINNIPTPTCTS